jgi:hypothetical protein
MDRLVESAPTVLGMLPWPRKRQRSTSSIRGKVTHRRRPTNNAIRKALKQFCKRLEAADPKLKLVPDEATRDTSGSPNIALKILEKIEEAAIVVADITTVTSPGAAQPCPNANVGYELGYAVAMLGWDRVILLFNKAFGQFPADLPFDFIQNRASPYHYEESNPLSNRN